MNSDYPILDTVLNRWSPYAFNSRPVSDADLQSLFEAARFAPSAFNAQPWRYIVARQSDPEAFNQMLSCLVEANQAWAKYAPVLVLGITRVNYEHNGKPNRCALHDLGLATGNLLSEATSRGIYVHQMAGILPDRARELYGFSDDFQAVTGIAMGYPGANKDLPENIVRRDDKRNPRKPQSEFVFYGEFNR